MSATATAPSSARDSYYGRAILKQPTWTWEIPYYFFFGGMAGASAALAAVADLQGEDELARRAYAVSLGAIAVSPALLISDLGRPSRFLNMLRVFKPTSPMSMGTWILNGTGATVTLAAARSWFGIFPRAGRASGIVAAFLGPALSTYTAVLVSNTAIPVWHEARHELPFVFASGAAMSAGSAMALTGCGTQARRLAMAGALGELTTSFAMEHRLGPLAEPYREGRAGRYAKAAKGLTGVGALTMAAARGRRPGVVAGAAMMLGGALATRWAVFQAGRQGAADPKYVVEPQRPGARRGRSAARPSPGA